MKKVFVKTILSSSSGHSIMCLGMPLCPATVITLGKYLGNFHFIPRWQILRVATLSGVGCREAETWRAVIKKQIRAVIPYLPACPDCCCWAVWSPSWQSCSTCVFFGLFPLTLDILLARRVNYCKNIHWQQLLCCSRFLHLKTKTKQKTETQSC